jgi:hypothetical protein
MATNQGEPVHSTMAGGNGKPPAMATDPALFQALLDIRTSLQGIENRFVSDHLSRDPQ